MAFVSLNLTTLTNFPSQILFSNFYINLHFFLQSQTSFTLSNLSPNPLPKLVNSQIARASSLEDLSNWAKPPSILRSLIINQYLVHRYQPLISNQATLHTKPIIPIIIQSSYTFINLEEYVYTSSESRGFITWRSLQLGSAFLVLLSPFLKSHQSDSGG